MVEITEAEQNKENIMKKKKSEDSLRDLEDNIEYQHLNYRVPRRRREKERIQ